jgi:hypothetical protein
MNFQECIRCKDWRKGGRKIRKSVKKAIYTLYENDLFEVKVQHEVCENCQRAIGKECADTLLKLSQNGSYLP